jgi:hypothetical protein
MTIAQSDIHRLHAGKLGPEPKACPYCGTDPLPASFRFGRFQVGCVADECDVNPQVSGATITEAWDRWNRRVPCER